MSDSFSFLASQLAAAQIALDAYISRQPLDIEWVVRHSPTGESTCTASTTNQTATHTNPRSYHSMSTNNGVNVEQLGQTIEAITDDPTGGQFQFRAATEWTDALQSVTTINGFDQAGDHITTQEFTINGDEPEEILGNRTAPNAVELLLAALGSCLSVGYAANAAAMDIELNDLRFELEGDVDLRGFLGISEDVRAGYNTVTCTTYIDADATDDELADLRERVETTSPLIDNISNEVSLETTLVAPERGVQE